MVDTFRGHIRVRKWPRKRGPSKLAKQRRQVKWFTDANALAKRLWPDQVKLAMIMTKGTGLYPRDLLLRQMSGGIYDLFTGDDVHYRPRSFFRETRMFQGAILQLDANQTMPANTFVTLSWPLPVLDTLGFYDAGAPTRLTIQAGINVVELNAGWAAVGELATHRTLLLFLKNGALIRAHNIQQFSDPNMATPSGPLVTTEGDFFEVRVRYDIATEAIAGIRTYFALNVLDAD